MICPSCSERLTDSLKHCVHCGIAITRRSVQMARVINNFGWIARRALGGFFAGGIGWLLSIAVLRALRPAPSSDNPFLELLGLFPGQVPLGGAIAACFVGTVGGMIERSAYKAFLGGLLGAAGGCLGALSFPLWERLFQGQIYAYSFSMAGSWSLGCAFVGLTSGILEGTRSKIGVGFLGGLLGGALGGGIASQMYGALLMEFDDAHGIPWIVGRLLEFSSGATLGVSAWFFIGLAEKLYIFRRRQLIEGSKKVCDHCHSENELNAWYCAQCGSALQVAASREQFRLTPYRGLERVANALQFLSWLSATTGVVAAIVVLFSFFVQNFLFALFGSIVVGLAVYILAIAFKAAADAVRMGIQVSEKIGREASSK